MTKKKMLIYFIIFIVSVSITAVFKHYFLIDPAKDFPEVCKIAIGPNCTQHLRALVEEQKYDDVVKILKVRICDNKALLASFKSKISNKDLLKMNSTKVLENLLSCKDLERCKADYYLLETAIVTVKDIVNDSITVADIQENQYKDNAMARKSLKSAIDVLEKNVYVSSADDTIKALSEKIESLK